jgi:uncharacterized protein
LPAKTYLGIVKNTPNLIGRESEIKELQEALASPYAELVAVYGRRRVGKTYLVNTLYESSILLELTGLNNAGLSEQLENFGIKVAAAFKLPLMATPPQNWLQAFHFLRQVLAQQLAQSETKRVLFLDELPWFDSHKSGFLSAFDDFWNTWASRQQNLVVVICGSAASWMIQNIVNNKGGLHNRITRRIRLLPFNLNETERFLQSQHINFDRHQLLQLYMVLGGIPHYLKAVRRGESVAQTIDRLCFTNDGLLSTEFQNLYTALFGSSEKHEAVVEALSNKPGGLVRNEILSACQISSGGSFSKLMDELLQSGFVAEHLPFNRTSKDSIYTLSDEFSLFYFKFMKNAKSFGEGSWQAKSEGASWKTWSGLAFEHICLKHVPQIKKALGISGVYTEQSVWRYTPKSADEQGAQIDLVIDRKDNCINLCEIKFVRTEYTIDKNYAEALDQKRRLFMAKTNTQKSVFTTMITTYGVKENGHYLNSVQRQISMGVLFEP